LIECERIMVGVLGFEPRNTRIKIAELTTCRHPNKHLLLAAIV
jgi:hypothetical protein